MNSIVISGNLGRDPELKSSSKGTSILSFSVADKQWDFQERKNVTAWWRCVIFGKRAESLSKVLAKGAGVTVFGVIKQREYTDRNGNKVVSYDIMANDVEILNFGKGGQSEKRENNNSHSNPGYSETPVDDYNSAPFDDEVPF